MRTYVPPLITPIVAFATHVSLARDAIATAPSAHPEHPGALASYSNAANVLVAELTKDPASALQTPLDGSLLIVTCTTSDIAPRPMPGVTQYAVDALANVARTTVVVPLRAPTNLQLNSRAFPNPTPSTVTLVPPLTCPRRGAMPEIAILAAFAPSFARRCCRCTDALVNRARVAFDASARAATAMSASKATNAMRLAFARHLARRARRGGDGMGVDGPRRAPCSDATRRRDVV